MNGAGASGLGSAAASAREQEAPSPRAGEAAAALWLALTQRCISAEQQLPKDQIETTSAWRPSAGDLTPSMGPMLDAGDAATNPPAPERLTLRVDGGELGELSVTLDREAGALRVVIGLENGRMVSSVQPDVRALRSALEQVGISVQSLNVVPASEVGTVLAQRRPSPPGPRHSAEHTSSEPDPEQARKRTHKRLTLIG